MTKPRERSKPGLRQAETVAVPPRPVPSVVLSLVVSCMLAALAYYLAWRYCGMREWWGFGIATVLFIAYVYGAHQLRPYSSSAKNSAFEGMLDDAIEAAHDTAYLLMVLLLLLLPGRFIADAIVDVQKLANAAQDKNRPQRGSQFLKAYHEANKNSAKASKLPKAKTDPIQEAEPGHE